MSAVRTAIIRAMRLTDLTPDAVVLHQAAAGDSDAVRTLVDRHGPMVLRVCRHILGDADAAQDAFQAVFLTMIRRQWRLQRPERLAAWLFGVARRTALKSKTATQRRRKRERRPATLTVSDPLGELTAREMLAALDQEIERLPEPQRLPLLLCYWQGLTQDEIARRLGWSAGSVKGRLERGRKQLAARLTKRGLAPSILLTVASSTIVPGELFAKTAALAATGAAMPAGVLAVCASGTMAKTISSITAAVVLIGTGLVGMTVGFASPEPPKNEAPTPAAAQPAVEERNDVVTVRGRVLDPDGKAVPGARIYTLRILPDRVLFISDENVEPTLRTTTGRDGAFQFEIPRDKLLVEHNRLWPVMAVARGYGLGWTRAKLPSDDLTIHLVKDEPVSGRLVNSQGQPVTDANIRIRDLRTGTDDRLDAFLAAWKVDWQNSWGELNKRTVPPGEAVRVSPIDRDGRFTITGAGVDRYVIFEITSPSMAITRGAIINRAGLDAAPLNEIAQKLAPR